jgi:hypothetical protein
VFLEKSRRGCEAGPVIHFTNLSLVWTGHAVVFELIKRHKLVHSHNGNKSHEKIRQVVCVVCSKLVPKAVMQVPTSKQRFSSQIAAKL